MKLIRFCFVLVWLCIVNNVRSEIDRSDKGYDDNRFLVVNTGRVETVLMWLKGIDVWACAETCVRHLSCVSFNYQHEMEWCELTDRSFQVGWVDEVSPGWKNYATPDRVHGNFSEWTEFGECSVVCGGVGNQTRRRFCNNPAPMFGGRDCVGKKMEKKECNNGHCQNLALHKPAQQSTTKYLAKKANDGNRESKSGTGNVCTPVCWWLVDLKQNSTIKWVSLRFGHEYVKRIKNRIDKLVVKISEDKINWMNCRQINKEAKLLMRYPCDRNSNKAKYVRVEMVIPLFIREVYVIGKYT